MNLNNTIFGSLLSIILIWGTGGNRVAAQPLNDLPCNSINLEVEDSCEFSIYSNLDATDSGLPDPGCGSYEGGDVWFTVIIPPSGSISIQTDTEAMGQFPDSNGWMFRIAMALYRGDCNDLSLLGCYQNNSIYHPRAAGAFLEGESPGDTIRVRIWEFLNDENGNFKICVNSQSQCPSSYDIAGGGSFCEGDSGVTVSLSGSETGTTYTLMKNDTVRLDTIPGSGAPLTWSALKEEGIYKVIAKDNTSGCTRIMNDSAEVVALPVTWLGFEVVSITCFEDNDGSINTTPTGGKGPYLYNWTGPGGFTSSKEDLSDLSPGIYELTLTDSNQCQVSSPPLEITEPGLLVVSLEQITHLTVYEANDGSVDISISGGTTPYTVSWTGTDDFSSDEADPSGMTVGYYRVVVNDSHFCMDSLEMIMVSVEHESDGVFIPGGFSPNGDGYNDFFEILGLENFPENELRVFNRQGVEIFRVKNYENDWDGLPEKGGVMGGEISEGTYYYVFKYGETGIRKGFFYLNRE